MTASTFPPSRKSALPALLYAAFIASPLAAAPPAAPYQGISLGLGGEAYRGGLTSDPAEANLKHQEEALGGRSPRLRVGAVKQPDGNGRKFVPKALLPDVFKVSNPVILIKPPIAFS